MEYALLKQSTIELITGIKYRKVPSVLKQIPEKTIEEQIVTTKVLTDGEISVLNRIVKNGTKTIEFINDKTKLSYIVDKIISQRVKITDANYVIKISCAKEFVRQGNIAGWPEVIKNIEIYIKDPKDKETLRIVKDTIKQITNNKLSDYPSLYNYVLTNNASRKNTISYQEKQINVYRLTRAKQ